MERGHTSLDIKYLIQIVLDCYTMCRNSNIPVSGSIPQEKVMVIAEKLEISNFIASNSWLETFKHKYSICNTTVAGETGDVSKETMDNWNQHARKFTTGWNARVWNMDQLNFFAY